MGFTVTSDAQLCLCSCPNYAVAEQLAQQLVERSWSACVQIVPGITSIFRWQGKVCQETEVLLVVKSGDMIDQITRWLIAAHPYEVPEVITVPISAGSQAYLDWLLANSNAKE